MSRLSRLSRCEKCNKKLGMIEYKCKCGNNYCITHLHSEEHNCSFNYKEEGMNELKKRIDVGSLDTKIERI
jgi:hypothetical protein